MELLKFLLRIERRRLQLTVHKRRTQPNITRFPRYGVKIERVGCKRRELNGYHNIKRDLNIQTPVTFCSAVYPWIDPWSLPWSIARSAGGRNLENQQGQSQFIRRADNTDDQISYRSYRYWYLPYLREVHHVGDVGPSGGLVQPSGGTMGWPAARKRTFGISIIR